MDEQNTANDGQAPDLVFDKDGSMKAETNAPQTATKIMVNDITPPPSPSSTGQAIEVTSELKEEDIASVNEAVEAVSGSAEESSVVAAPPEETEEETLAEEPVESVEQPQDEVDADQTTETSPESAPPADEPEPTEPETQPTPTPSIAAATEQPTQGGDVVMGVAASQIAANAAKPAHRNNKKFAAIVTVLVALVLVGTAVYVYMSANSNTEESGTANQPVVQQEAVTPEPTPATAADVDQAVTDIEQSVNALDDGTELNEADLSDTTLGL
jgi:hypothetical protein